MLKCDFDMGVVNLLDIFKTSFLKNTSGGLLLPMSNENFWSTAVKKIPYYNSHGKSLVLNNQIFKECLIESTFM